MRRRLTGRHEVTVVAGERIQAFIPDPLPPKPPLELTAQRQQLLERATLALGRLDSVTLLLPDPDLFLYAYVRREAVLSSQIEGTQSSLAQLLLFELEEAPGVPLDDVVEVSNYVAALTHGLKRLQEGFPLSNRLIREMHAVLLARGRGSEKSPGEFRRSQNWIGGTRPGNAYFVPPPPHSVQDRMAELERFLHGANNPYPALIKAALAHVQFETIHPFLDGNGRIGRLLIAFVLHCDQVLSQPILYLSLYFKQHRDEYYRLLNQVRTEGDWEAWLDFFLEGVEQTATNAVETAKRLLLLFQRDEQKIHAAGRGASTALRVFRVMCERPLVNLNQVCERTGLSFPAVARAMQTLEKLGLVRENTGQRRNRVFVYHDYLNILSEGTEAI
ncbi:MAG: Fic family protein [Pseudanabaenaceae cyanobacterium]